MRKMFMFILVLCSMFIFSACNQTDVKSNESGESASTTQVTKKSKDKVTKEESVQQKTNPATVEVVDENSE